ncbi:MAG TPA: hypothetical protein V6D05_15350 [Stenomitos sp.]
MSHPLRTLLLADDATRDRYRAPLRDHAACQVIGEVSDGEDGLHFASLSQPDLVILGESGDALDTVRRLGATVPWAKLMVLGLDPDDPRRLSFIQAGVLECVAHDDPQALKAAIERLAKSEPAPESASDQPAGRIIACYSPKGGIGRSTLAINLAISLYRTTGRETILLDGGFHLGDLDLMLNLQPQQGIASVLSGSRLDGALAQHPTGIKLLGWTRGDRHIKTDKLKSLLLWLKQRDCWVVVDTHPGMPETNRAILAQADRTFVPVGLDVTHIRALQRDLADLQADGVDTRNFELATWGEKSDVSRQEVAKILKRPLDWILPHEPSAARHAINQGIPILQADPRGALARELERMALTFGESSSRALVPMKAGNPFGQLISWLRKGPAAGYGA